MVQFAKTELALHDLNEHLKTSKVSHNAFSDWTDEERDSYLSVGLHNDLRTEAYIHEMDTRFAELDQDSSTVWQHVDWTLEKDVVQPASEYSLCRSVWADTAASVIESSQ